MANNKDTVIGSEIIELFKTFKCLGIQLPYGNMELQDKVKSFNKIN
jgi:hypothetical protein